MPPHLGNTRTILVLPCAVAHTAKRKKSERRGETRVRANKQAASLIRPRPLHFSLGTSFCGFSLFVFVVLLLLLFSLLGVSFLGFCCFGCRIWRISFFTLSVASEEAYQSSREPQYSIEGEQHIDAKISPSPLKQSRNAGLGHAQTFCCLALR